MDSIESKKLFSIEVQRNGIIRNSKGYLIGRLVDGVAFDSEHVLSIDEKTDDISDGYHTFGELYEHRIRLYIALCKLLCSSKSVWCSIRHSDGTSYEGWFVLGINKNKGEQITYHLPARFWNEVCEFAEILDIAPEYDGHSSQDVLHRISIIC